MKALHTIWSKPMIYGTGTFFAEDFEILTLALSALKWREKNGTIKLVTDRVAHRFYERRGLLSLWDEVTTELDRIPDTINPKMFWAAGKIFAVGREAVPTASIDTDFIVWEKLDFEDFPDLTVIHSEDITPEVYPGRERFNMRDGYEFDPSWDFCTRPYNAAFYVMKNEKLKSAYTTAAERFMESAGEGDNLTYMVFAEQRIMAMTARKLGASVRELSTLERLFGDGERCFTHTWGMKRQMRESGELRRDFCLRCAGRLKRDFPDYSRLLAETDELRTYF